MALMKYVHRPDDGRHGLYARTFPMPDKIPRKRGTVLEIKYSPYDDEFSVGSAEPCIVIPGLVSKRKGYMAGETDPETGRMQAVTYVETIDDGRTRNRVRRLLRIKGETCPVYFWPDWPA